MLNHCNWLPGTFLVVFPLDQIIEPWLTVWFIRNLTFSIDLAVQNGFNPEFLVREFFVIFDIRLIRGF